MMKKLLLVFSSFFVLCGCNNNAEVQLSQSDMDNLSYHYAEQSYRYATFIGALSNQLEEENVNLADRHLSFINGFEIGVERENIYDDVQKIIHSKYAQYLGEQNLKLINRILSEMRKLPETCESILIQAQKENLPQQHVLQLSEDLEKLYFMLYPDNNGNEQITLYNMLASPAKTVNAYNEKQITTFLNDLYVAISKFNQTK